MADIVFSEQSSGIVTCAFVDEDGASVVPNLIKWSLTTADGQIIINNREQVEVAAPASEIDIVLTGDDLQILDAEASKKYVVRKLIIEAEYDSDLGDNLPLTGEATLKIKNLAYVNQLTDRRQPGQEDDMGRLQKETAAKPEAALNVEGVPEVPRCALRTASAIQDEITTLTVYLKNINMAMNAIGGIEAQLRRLGEELTEVRDLEQRLVELRPARDIEAEIASLSTELRAAIESRASGPEVEAALRRLGAELEDARKRYAGNQNDMGATGETEAV